MEVRKEVLNAPRTGSPEEGDRLGPRSKGAIVGQRCGCASARTLRSANCADLFIVSQVALRPGGDGVSVTVEHADGAKCERCWKYTTDVGSRPEVHPGICAACASEVERFRQ